jgi:hypothetical protein
MINRYVRRMLDENGTEVVRANYIKELAVATLSKDRHRLIQFNNGEASLGEVDEWLKDQNRRQSGLARAGVIIGGVSLFIAVVSLIVAIVALTK